MSIIPQEALTGIRDRQSLYEFLRNTMKWEVDPGDTLTYDVTEVEGLAGTTIKVSQVVQFSGDDPFVILLAEFDSGFYRSRLRDVLQFVKRKMREEGHYPGKGPEDIILICPSGDYREMRFAHFEERESRQPHLSVFGWETEDASKTRTVRDLNLSKLEYSGGLTPDEWRKRWLAAWDVSAVTKDFFATYVAVFDFVESEIDGITGDDQKRLFTQRLFNRLLFIKFLEKKGWMSFGGRKDYLDAMLEAAEAAGENFYADRLYWAFFHGLGVLPENREAHTDPRLVERRGDVPYLNGGLFEMESGDEKGAVRIPNAAFRRVLDELFAPYNFTITEGAPDDVDVAVDPEMLGKVFEELVTGRHESGSYYTPRSIVAFMCREAIKGYLGGYETLVDFHDASDITIPVAGELLAKLDNIKVVDPACGSGAYLLGMLYELFTLARLLDTRAGNATARDDYQRKLAIIQNDLYGVDIDPFAVNIARLRLWLALVVEYDGDDPQPLPNLDFKVEVGDSLLGPGPAQATTGDIFRHEPIARFAALKADYGDPFYQGDKHALRRQIDAVRAELAASLYPGDLPTGFLWRVEFAEVFDREGTAGFDVALANPPYIRMELFKDIKPQLKHTFAEVHADRADLYVYFYARAVQLLRTGGMLAFISSNKWFRARYGERLRSFISATCNVRSITDFGELPVFEAAATFPMVFLAQRNTPQQPASFTQVTSLEEPYPDVQRVIQMFGKVIPPIAVAGSTWTLATASELNVLDKMERMGSRLDDYAKGRIYYGIKSGLNAAFYLDRAQRDALCEHSVALREVIKPLLVGDDVRKWHTRAAQRYLIYLTDSADISELGHILDHLIPFRGQLEARALSQAWFALQQPQARYASEWAKHKIVYPDIAKESRFTLDRDGYYINDTCFAIGTDDLYLLGVLNSAAVWHYLAQRAAVLGDAGKGGRLRLKSTYMSSLPIPRPSEDERLAISILVQKCLDAKGENCEEWEREIDERVEFLYFGRTPGSPEASFEQHLKKLQDEVRALILRGEGQGVEFKETLEVDNVTGTANPGVLLSALKTIAGFLNAAGGVLLLGVADNCEILGIERDYHLCGKRQDPDGFENKLRSLIVSRFEPVPTGAVTITFIRFPEGTVAKVEVQALHEVTHLDKAVFVRDGNRTAKLEGPAFTSWLARRYAAKAQ